MAHAKRMLIVASGPSTKELVDRGLHDLRPDVHTFGMGAEYRFFRQASWWPTYYALCDSKVVFSHRDELRACVEDPSIATERFFFSWPVSEHERCELVDHASTGDFCFRKSIELGYREIYIIGIEGHYVEELSESRPLSDKEFRRLGFHKLNLNETHRSTLRIFTETPQDNPNYFFAGYQQVGDVYSLPQSTRHSDRWGEAAELAGTVGVEVTNLSPQSRIEHFPKSTLENVRGRLLQSPTTHGETDGETAPPAPDQPEYWFGPFDRQRTRRVEETKVILDLFGSGDLRTSSKPVMVDVGACRGSAFGGFAAKGWKIHAFEPNPALYEDLRERKASPEVVINNSAVSDVEGDEIPFYTSEESIGISSLQPFRPSHELAAKVKTIRLDGYLRDHGIDHVDFLKIDTEGFDLMVLRGLDLAQQQVGVIVCEFEDSKSEPLGYSFRDMADYLQGFGYTVYVSEWHPVIRYGGPHQWRILKSYPCGLDAPDAWGNLFAFRSDPGMFTLTRAVARNIQILESTARQLENARAKITELEHKLSALYASGSWRITAPLRAAQDAAMRVLRRRRRPAPTAASSSEVERTAEGNMQ